MAPDRVGNTVLSALRTRISTLGLSASDAWANYLQCGGRSGYLEFEAYLYGALAPPPYEWTAIQHSVWEAETF